MSIQQSDITDLNYDLVVGVSQRSVNGIMKQYYANSAEYFLQQTCYFTNHNPTPLSWNEVQNLGVDPFSIPSWNGQGTMPANIQQCVNGGFNCAFKFTPGDPGDPTVPTFPAWDYNYLTFLPQETFYGQTYNYTLCCSNIQVVYWDPFTNMWVNYTQPSAKGSPASSIVKFCTYATLGNQTKTYSANDYKTPADVRTQAAALQANNISFTIQQLVLSFNESMASPMSTLPFMLTIGECYYQFLAPAFLNAYSQALKSSFKDVPTVCYTLPQTNQSNKTVINPTHVQSFVENYVDANGNIISNPTTDQVNLSTLNYFCAVNGNTPVAPKQFNWNWLDSDNDASSYDGVIALSKYALGKIFFSQLQSYIESNCWVPQISCTNNNGTDAWSFNMQGNGVLNTNVVLMTNSNNVFLISLYNPAPTQVNGVVNTGDYVEITPQFQLEVSIKDATTITVSQLSQFSYTIKIGGGEAMPGIPLNISYSQDYSVVVQPDGTLDFAPGQLQTWGGPSNQMIPYLTNQEAENMVQSINNTVNSMKSADLSATPLGNIQQFILPGGNAFMFKNAQFTAKHDLACEVTYLKTS